MMKAKYFKKIRSQVKWYKVSYRDSLFFSFSDEKEILAKSPENASVGQRKQNHYPFLMPTNLLCKVT